MTEAKRAAVLEAVQKLTDGVYGATAIKVELEADLDRSENIDTCFIAIFDNLSKRTGVSWDGNQLESDWEGDTWATNPTPEIAYARFYNDGSVDSELTFTLRLDKPENIFLLPKIVEAWNEMCSDMNGGEVNIEGAGMHMALLNNEDCTYPHHRMDYDRFHNFQRSMTMLLPALYFLGTHNDISRPLEYRQPVIGCDGDAHGSSKFNAVHYKDGALEFRIFDTCYDKPEAILDNVVVMRNCMKYWSKTYTNPGLDKITRSVLFGNDTNYRLDRFYSKIEHIDLLNLGLRRLKPSYYSVAELKEERRFVVERRMIVGWRKQAEEEARNAYEEYSERYDWSMIPKKYYLLYQFLDTSREHTDTAVKAAEHEAEKIVEEEKKKKIPLTEWVQGKVREELASRDQSYYSLQV